MELTFLKSEKIPKVEKYFESSDQRYALVRIRYEKVYPIRTDSFLVKKTYTPQDKIHFVKGNFKIILMLKNQKATNRLRKILISIDNHDNNLIDKLQSGFWIFLENYLDQREIKMMKIREKMEYFIS